MQFIFVSKVVPQHVVETGQLLCSILQIQFVFLCNSWFSQCAINVAVVVALTETEDDCWQFFFHWCFLWSCDTHHGAFGTWDSTRKTVQSQAVQMSWQNWKQKQRGHIVAAPMQLTVALCRAWTQQMVSAIVHPLSVVLFCC